MAVASVLSGCATREVGDSVRPESLIGTWVGRNDATPNLSPPDSVSLTLDRDATATIRRWSAPSVAPPFDSTARYALWKADGDGVNRAGMLCLHLPATGSTDCLPIQAQAGDSLRITLPARLAAPGTVVSATLRRAVAGE